MEQIDAVLNDINDPTTSAMMDAWDEETTEMDSNYQKNHPNISEQ